MNRFDMFQKRLGLFVHWGIYAVGGWQEQELGRLGRDRGEYERYAARFNPTDFDPDAWLDLAEEAGMSYLVFTAKHHDGFCMWDSKTTDYCVRNTPYGRDVLKLLADACARRGFPLGIYYSNPDWHHPHAHNPLSSHQMPPLRENPDFSVYLDDVRAQITELLSNYGPICCLFWDISPHMEVPALQQLARDLQPGIWINDRGWGPGDYATPERTLPDDAPYAGNVEACQSVGRQSWGYRKNEDYYSASFLKKSVLQYLLRGGNYLLNAGPTDRGVFPPEAVRLLRDVGRWHRAVREALAADWQPALAQREYEVTRRGTDVYLLLTPPVDCSGYAVPFLRELPRGATLLNTGEPLPFEIERFPTRHNRHAGAILPDCLHVWNLPCDSLHEPLAVKLSGAEPIAAP